MPCRCRCCRSSSTAELVHVEPVPVTVTVPTLPGSASDVTVLIRNGTAVGNGQGTLAQKANIQILVHRPCGIRTRNGGSTYSCRFKTNITIICIDIATT